MSLEELNEKLHGRDVHLDRTRQHTSYDPGQTTSDPGVQSQFQKTEAWRDPVTEHPPSAQELVFSDISARKRRRRIAIVLGSIAALLLLGGLVLKARTMFFSEESVSISVSGPKNVASAEETTFTIAYENKNWAGLDNAVLVLSYPGSFHPSAESSLKTNNTFTEISLGSIPARTQGEKTITGKFYGSKGDLAYFQAMLRYTPHNVATVLEKTDRFSVNVASSPLSLEITAPLESAPGQDIEYVIDYGNVGDLQFSNLRVKAEYPEGFQFVSAEPKPSEGESVWYVGTLDARAQGKIIVRGVLSGTRDEYKHMRGMIGFFQGDGKFVSYAENERQTHVVASPFSLSQTVNGLTDITVNPGDMLRYVIRYKNESDIGMRDAIVTVEINPTSLDMSRLTLQRGAYDAARKMIIWKASDVPSLGKIEPGESGEITFSVPVLTTFSGDDGKNLSIRSVAKIDSPDIPTSIGANKIIGSNMLFVKLNSSVGVDIRALYDSPVLPNSGPFPPKVGEETSYTLHMSIANSSNDLKQARLSLMLPTGVRYTGKFAPGGEVISYNERTNEFVWELGVFSPTKGTPRILDVQIAATPSPGNAGDPLILMNGAAFTAKDAFTDRDVRIEKEKIDSNLRADTTYSTMSGKVQSAP